MFCLLFDLLFVVKAEDMYRWIVLGDASMPETGHSQEMFERQIGSGEIHKDVPIVCKSILKKSAR